MAYQRLQSAKFKTITPSDTDDIKYGSSNVEQSVGLYVGGSGDIQVMSSKGDIVVFRNIIQGSFLPILVKRVYATNTTATDIVGLW